MKRFAKVIVLKKSGQGGSEFPLPSGRCSIGRDRDCDIRIQSSGVGAVHCLVIIDAKNQAHLVNVSGSAGLLLNGEPLLNEAFLTHGDKFSILSREFCFEWCLKTAKKDLVAPPSSTPSSSFYGQSGTRSPRRSTRNAGSFQAQELDNTAASESFLNQTAFKTPRIPPEMFVSPLHSSLSTEQTSMGAMKSPQMSNLGTPVNKLSRKRNFSPASPTNSALGSRVFASSSFQHETGSAKKSSLSETETISTSTPLTSKSRRLESKERSTDQFACSGNASTAHISGSCQSPKAKAARTCSSSRRHQACIAKPSVHCGSSINKSGTIEMSWSSVLSGDSEDDGLDRSSRPKRPVKTCTAPPGESLRDGSPSKMSPGRCSRSTSASCSNLVRKSRTPLRKQTARKSTMYSSIASTSGLASSPRSRSASTKHSADIVGGSRQSSRATTNVEETSLPCAFEFDRSLHSSSDHSQRSEKSKNMVASKSSMRASKSQQGSPQQTRAVENADISPWRSLTGTTRKGSLECSLRRTSSRSSVAASTARSPRSSTPRGISQPRSPRNGLDSSVGNLKVENLAPPRGSDQQSPEPSLPSKNRTGSNKSVPRLTAASPTTSTSAQGLPLRSLRGTSQPGSIHVLPRRSASARRSGEISSSHRSLKGSSNGSPEHNLQTSPLPGSNESPSVIAKNSSKTSLRGSSRPQSPKVGFGLDGLDSEEANRSLACSPTKFTVTIALQHIQNHTSHQSQSSSSTSKRVATRGSPAIKCTDKGTPVCSLLGAAKAVPHPSPSNAGKRIHLPSRTSPLNTGDDGLLQETRQRSQSAIKTERDSAAAMPVYSINEGASTSAASFYDNPITDAESFEAVSDEGDAFRSRKRLAQPGNSDGSPTKRSLLENKSIRSTRGSEVSAVQGDKNKRTRKAAPKSSFAPGSPTASPGPSQDPQATSPVRRTRRKAAVAAEKAFSTKKVPPKTRRKDRKDQADTAMEDEDSAAADEEALTTRVKAATKKTETPKMGTARKSRTRK